MEIRVTVLQRGPARYDMVGQRLSDILHEMAPKISKRLVSSLFRYASEDLKRCGFDISGWDCEIYTMDADQRVDDRSYTVEFTNQRGGKIGVSGILTSDGKPCFDHGIFAERA